MTVMELLKCATPRNGYVRHVVIDRPERRHQTFDDLTYAPALCGVRGRDSWGLGFMQLDTKNPDPEATDCARCLRKVRKMKGDRP